MANYQCLFKQNSELHSRGLLFILTHSPCAPVSVPFAPLSQSKPLVFPNSLCPHARKPWARVLILSGWIFLLSHHLQRELFYSHVLWRDCVDDFEWHSSSSTLLYLRTRRLWNHLKKFCFLWHFSWHTYTFFFFTIEFLDCV